MKIKPGVRLEGMTERTLWALNECDQFLRTLNLDVVVTSGRDSHDSGLHPMGRAFDLRLPSRLVFEQFFGHGSWDKQERDFDVDVVSALKLRLGAEFDVVLERHQKNPYYWHVHVENDPKDGK